MKIAWESKPGRLLYNQEILDEFNVPRFIWVILNTYHAAFGKRQVNDQYWAQQITALENFNQQNPGMHRPAGMAPAERP